MQLFCDGTVGDWHGLKQLIQRNCFPRPPVLIVVIIFHAGRRVIIIATDFLGAADTLFILRPRPEPLFAVVGLRWLVGHQRRVVVRLLEDVDFRQTPRTLPPMSLLEHQSTVLVLRLR